jgi:uncharacterized protein (TIGR00645 family)
MFKPAERVIETVIFGSRWLLLPLYLGMVVAQTVFAIKFVKEVLHLVHGWQDMSEGQFVQMILVLLDLIMVANLMLIVLIGGYATFVSKLDVDGHEDRPAWLDHIDPGTLKTKLASGLVGISGIHLLMAFIKISETKEGAAMDQTALLWQVIIHGVFVVAVLLLAYADLIVEKKVAMGNHGGA